MLKLPLEKPDQPVFAWPEHNEPVKNAGIVLIDQMAALLVLFLRLNGDQPVFAIPGFIGLPPRRIPRPSPAPITIYCSASCTWLNLFLFGRSS